jgi:hypothetical protein
MTSYNTPAPAVVTYSSDAGICLAWQAFDQTNAGNQYWVANGATGWVEIDLGQAAAINSYTISFPASGAGAETRAPQAWTLSGSNDNTNWTTLDTQSGQTSWAAGEMRTFNLPTLSATYRYFKINFTANNGDSYLDVGEIELIDQLADSIDATINIVPQVSGNIFTSPKLAATINIIPVISGSITTSVYQTANLNITLPKLQFVAYGGALLNIRLPKILFSAHGTNNNLGVLNIILPRLRFLGNLIQEQLVQLQVILPKLQFSAGGINSGIAQLNITLPKLTFEANHFTGSIAQLNISLPLIGFKASAYWQGINALNIPLPKILFSAIMRSKETVTLVLNMKNFALTEYDNSYNYNSLFNFNGQMVGVRRDGIYELTGDDDNGAMIAWDFKTGKIDTEDGLQHKMRYAWLSYRPSGDLILTVYDGENEYEYDVESYKQIDNAVRIKVGKGIRNRFLQFGLRNVSNEKIFLDRLRLFADPIKEKKR